MIAADKFCMGVRYVILGRDIRFHTKNFVLNDILHFLKVLLNFFSGWLGLLRPRRDLARSRSTRLREVVIRLGASLMTFLRTSLRYATFGSALGVVSVFFYGPEELKRRLTSNGLVRVGRAALAVSEL